MKLRKLLFAKIKARYDEQVSPYYAASRLGQMLLSIPDTRKLISMGIEQPTTPLSKKTT
jgi:hypothetical protein